VRVGPWYYGIDARPGILLSPSTLLYGRIGVCGTSLKLNTDASNEFTAVGTFEQTSFSGSKRRNGAFLRLGGGIEHHLTSNLTFVP
jgi:opacity protein-like surface antigen